ncbi:GNAT family N-acetyltransferase [Saliphagus infecundisoli]|uniref:GNAT family N-acetyltransferase n=1 Tax=Saliphagus infecundisoli TaxID=1849069 RepID=A0ABD5QAD8_9EURY|nr:GNAT family N-acetyltransferase [Saliphagus infecundisoli]
MTEIEGPRLVTREEFPEMMALLDRYFAYERGGMQARLPFVYDPDRSDRHAVILADGEIVSHVAAVPQMLSTGTSETVECWGISGVATDRRYRGEEYMTDLLEFWFDRMDNAGAPLSDLSGNRQRYGHFGYELAGSEYEYTITARSFDGEPEASPAVEVYRGEEMTLKDLDRIHGEEPYRAVRDREGGRVVFGQRGLETFVVATSDGPDDVVLDPAYLSLSRESRSRTVEEFGGSAVGLETLLAHVLAILDLNELSVRMPPWHNLERVLARHSRFWTARPHRKLRINDLQALLSDFEKQLEQRWLESGRAEKGSVTLKLPEGDSVRIAYSPEKISVGPGERESERKEIERGRRELVSLLFGLPDRTASLRSGDPFLETALPLRYFIWPTEHV